jgi:hypothetical protein
MPDPFAKVQPGQPVTFSATAWNAMLAAGRAEMERQFDRGTGTLTTGRNAAIVRVRNDSGVDLDRHAVLGLDGPIFTPTDSLDTFLQEVTFSGIEPVAESRGRFGILMEPAPIDRVVRAWVAGVCQVRVDLTDTAHAFAEIEAGETGMLVSGDTGSAELLWCESDGGGYGYTTGQQWALVRLGAVASVVQIARTTTSITARSSATYGSGSAKIQSDSGTALVDDGTTVTVKNMTDKTIASGAYVMIVRSLGKWWVAAVGSCGNLS